MAFELRHPSSKKLLRWLETGETGKVEQHVEECERCADKLVVLDKEETVREGGPSELARRERLTRLLTETFRAPDDLNERVVRGVEERSKTEAELMLLAGLMSVGFDTARLISNSSSRPADDGEARNLRYGHQNVSRDDGVGHSDNDAS